MTKKEKAKRKKIIKRSDAAINKLNKPKRRKKNAPLDQVFIYLTDFDKVQEFLEENEIPYEQVAENGITPSIVIHFDDDGRVFS